MVSRLPQNNCPQLEPDGVPRSVAQLTVGHKTDSVCERLCAASTPEQVGDGHSVGKVAAESEPSDVQNSANLLHFNHGPVAQKDRAAVS